MKNKTYKRREPVGYKLRPIDDLLKKANLTPYQLEKDTGLDSALISFLRHNPPDKLNPSFSTLTRLKKALGIKSWDEMFQEKD